MTIRIDRKFNVCSSDPVINCQWRKWEGRVGSLFYVILSLKRVIAVQRIFCIYELPCGPDEIASRAMYGPEARGSHPWCNTSSVRILLSADQGYVSFPESLKCFSALYLLGVGRLRIALLAHW